MAIPTMTNNSPAAGNIAWAAFTIQLYGVAYGVSAGSTSQRWVWWKYNGGAPVIMAGADVPTDLTDDDLVLFANKNGIAFRVQSSNFVDGELLVDGSIVAEALAANIISSNHIVTAGLDAGVIKFGTMSGDRIEVGTLQSDRVVVGGGDTTPLAQSLKNYVQARGTNLITNGSGGLGDNTNFSGMVFDKTDTPPGASGSFTKESTGNASVWADETISVDPAQVYKFAFSHKQLVGSGNFYSCLLPKDVYENTIAHYQVCVVPNTTTTLAAPLNPGDTVIELTDGSGWESNASISRRYIAFWDYVDPGGKLWAPNTYTRNVISRTDTWEPGGIVGNTINLVTPYAGQAKAAGTPISATFSGGSYIYPTANKVGVPEWTNWADTFGGVKDPFVSWGDGSLPSAVGKLKVGFLLNYYTPTSDLVKAGVANLSVYPFTEAFEAELLAESAYERWAPVGQTTIDGDKITANTIVGNHIMGQTIGAEKLVVGDLANMAEVNESYAIGPLYDTTHVISSGWSTRAAVTSAYFMFRNNHGPLPFKTGDRLRIAFDAYSTSAVTATPTLWVYGNASANQALTPIDITTTPTEFVMEVDVTVDTALKTTYLIGLNGVAGKSVFLRNVRAYRMNAAELIVDGSIVADHIGAEEVSTQHMAAESVTANQMRAESVTAESMVSSLNWTSEQYVGQIHIHPTQGITIPQDDSEEVTHLAADGSGNTFAGALVANDGLTSYGGVNMQGTDNFLAGELKAGTGVNDPSSAPLVTSSYDTVSVPQDDEGGFYRKGLSEFHDPGTPLWVTTDTYPGGDTNVQAWSKTGGPGLWRFDVLSGWQGYGGVTCIGAYYYILCRQYTNPTNWRILIYRGSDQQYMGSFATGPSGSIATTAYPGIGHDGTNILIAFTNNGEIFVRKFTPYGVSGAGNQVGSTMNGGAWSSSLHPQGVQQVSGKIYIGHVNGILAYTPGSTTMARDAASDFPKNSGALSGLSHDGTTWTTFTSGKIFTKHTTLSGRYLFAYDFRDADPLGSGTANTKPSPVKDITPVKFAKWAVTIPQIPPDDLTTDGANTCRIFASPYGSTLVFQHQLVTDGDGVSGKPLSYSKTFTDLASSGSAPNTVNDFASRATAVVGRYSSTKMDGSNPMWNLDGDGSWKLGGFLKGNVDGTNAYDSDWIDVVFASGYQSASRDLQVRAVNGEVKLRGNVQKTSGGYLPASSVLTVGTIPDSGGVSPSPTRIRPPATQEWQLPGSAGHLSVRAQITAAGSIVLVTGPSAPAYVSLDSVSYYNT